MESTRVRILLDRYFEGETSLSEEEELRRYFKSKEVDPDFQNYGVLFSAFAKAKKESSSHPINLPEGEKSFKIPLRWTTGVAAAVMISVGMYTYSRQQVQITSSYDTEEIAILKTKQALGVMSQMLSQSTAQLEVINEFEKASSTLIK